MSTALIIGIIFTGTNLIIVGVCWAVYGKKVKYEEGMLLGVHVPPYAQDEPDVRELLERYQSRSKRFYLGNMIFSFVILALVFYRTSVFILVWTVWLLAFVGVAVGMICVYHRRLYDLKVERGWFGREGANIVIADIHTPHEVQKKAVSVLWHVLFLLLTGMLCAVPPVRQYLLAEPEGWLFPGMTMGITLLFLICHNWTNRSGNRIYSEDSELNIRINGLEKRSWSVIWILCDLLNFSGMVLLCYGTGKNQWLDIGYLIGYIALLTLSAVPILAGLFCLKKRKAELLKENKAPLYIDDDVYWKNGWYENPNDKRWFVQDRLCSMNYTSNMAKPLMKWLTVLTLAGVVLGCLWLDVIFLRQDFGTFTLNVQGQEVSVDGLGYDIEFQIGDIEGAELIEELPDEKMNRTNGMADDRRLLGKFRGRETGECRLYIERGYSPILKLTLPEYTVFINSREPEQTQGWYEELMSNLRESRAKSVLNLI